MQAGIHSIQVNLSLQRADAKRQDISLASSSFPRCLVAESHGLNGPAISRFITLAFYLILSKFCLWQKPISLTEGASENGLWMNWRQEPVLVVPAYRNCCTKILWRHLPNVRRKQKYPVWSKALLSKVWWLMSNFSFSLRWNWRLYPEAGFDKLSRNVEFLRNNYAASKLIFVLLRKKVFLSPIWDNGQNVRLSLVSHKRHAMWRHSYYLVYQVRKHKNSCALSLSGRTVITCRNALSNVQLKVNILKTVTIRSGGFWSYRGWICCVKETNAPIEDSVLVGYKFMTPGE